MRTPSPLQLRPLLTLSAHIGRDLLLTQASAGNTSMKIDGRLWIKASGKWLADALQDDIFVPVDLSAARHSVRQMRAITAEASNSSGETLRPSVETAMHAMLPHRVIVHVHSVSTLVHAIRSDAQEHLEALLGGLRWTWVPYVSSGLPLARAVDQALRRRAGVEILVLGNHGLVVGGEDCEAVEDLLKQVEIRLDTVPRKAPQFDSDFLTALAQGSRWRLPYQTLLHSLATDDTARTILAKGSLYPCQALFLGGPDSWRPFYSGLYSEAKQSGKPRSNDRPFLVFKDKGVLLSDSITRTQLETLVGLAEVVQRLDMPVPIRYLTRAECEQITLHDVYRSRATPGRVAVSA